MIISFILFFSIVPHLFYSLNNDTQSVVISAAQSQISKFCWVTLADIELPEKSKWKREIRKGGREEGRKKGNIYMCIHWGIKSALKWIKEKENFPNDIMTSELFASLASIIM